MEKFSKEYKQAVSAAGMYLFETATHDDPAREFYDEITKPEREVIVPYLMKKGLSRQEIGEIERWYSNDISKKLLNGHSNILIKELKDYLLENRVEFEFIKNITETAFEGNSRLDPEEMVLIEKILRLESYVTNEDSRKFGELIKRYNQNRKLFLMIGGDPKALKHYIDEFQNAGYHTCSLHRDKSVKNNIVICDENDIPLIAQIENKAPNFEIRDQNEKGNANMVIYDPYSFAPQEKEKIKGIFDILFNKSTNKVPVLAINVKKGDTLKDFNVHAVLPVGATMPAIIERINELYGDFYRGRYTQ